MDRPKIIKGDINDKLTKKCFTHTHTNSSFIGIDKVLITFYKIDKYLCFELAKLKLQRKLIRNAQKFEL